SSALRLNPLFPPGFFPAARERRTLRSDSSAAISTLSSSPSVAGRTLFSSSLSTLLCPFDQGYDRIIAGTHPKSGAAALLHLTIFLVFHGSFFDADDDAIGH